jgi:hypothetical protein
MKHSKEPFLKSFYKIRYFFLLVLLLVQFTLDNFFDEHIVGMKVLDLIFLVMLLAGVYAISHSRKLFVTSLMFAVTAFAANVLVYILRDPSFALISFILYCILSVLIAIAILSDVLKGGRITTDKICGAICVYLFLGVIWALLYTIIEHIHPGSFTLNQTAFSPTDSDLGVYKYGHLSYYSFVTLTTLGYGDISPVTSPARSLAVLEAVVGQLYIAILIARLVGIHIAHSHTDKSEK